MSPAMTSSKSAAGRALPTPEPIVSFDELSGRGYFGTEEVADVSSKLDSQDTTVKRPADSVSNLTAEIYLLSAQIHNLSQRLGLLQKSGPSPVIDQDTNFALDASRRTINLNNNSCELDRSHRTGSQAHIPTERAVHELETFTGPWITPKVARDTCHGLYVMFTDFVHHGRPIRNIKGVKHPFNPSVSDDLSTTILVFKQSAASGQSTWRMLQWTPLDDIIAVRDEWESIYQQIGDAWPLSIEMTEQTLLRWNTVPASVNGHYGKRWDLCITDSVMTFSEVAEIACRVTLGHDIEFEYVGYCGLAFAKHFAGQWPETKWIKWCCTGRKACHIQFHMRSLAVNAKTSATTEEHRSSGLLIQREKGTINLPDGRIGFEIKECRMGAAAIARFDTDAALYSLVVLGDTKGTENQDLYGPDAWNDMCEEMHLVSCGRFKGVAMFQLELYDLLRDWGWRWNLALHHMEKIAKVEDALDLSRRATWTTQNYTKLLNLLRISSNWIQEGIDDLLSLREDFTTSFRTAPGEIFSNWDTLSLYQNRQGKRFLKRIERKIDELMSLREEHKYVTPT